MKNRIMKLFGLGCLLVCLTALAACGKKEPVQIQDLTEEEEYNELVESLRLSGIPFYTLGESDGETEPEDNADYGDPMDTKFADEWPDNEWTKQIPKPKYEKMITCSTSGNICMLTLEATLQETIDYCDLLVENHYEFFITRNDYSSADAYEFEATGMESTVVKVSYVKGILYIQITLIEK